VTRRHAIGRSGIAALLAGLVLRAAFVSHHPPFSGDALVYGDLAHNMLAHHVFGFTEDLIRPTLIRLPGYPLFLALCFTLFGNANYLAALWVQVAIDLATCVLLSLLAARLMGPRAGRIALWLAALCPFTANYAAAVLTETCTLFCVALAFFAFQRWFASWRRGLAGYAWAAVTGAALAFSVLLRPDQGLLAAAILPAMLWVGLSRRGLRVSARLFPATLASLIVALPLALWGARNWAVFHVVQPLAPRYANDPGESVPRGFQRWYRTWNIDFISTFEIYWNYDGNALNLADLPSRAFDSPRQLARTRALFDQYNQEQAPTAAFDQDFAALAAERVAAHPFRYYVVLLVARELDMWLRPRTELMNLPMDWWAVRSHPRRSFAEIAYAALDIAYLALAFLGLLRWRSLRWNGHRALAYAILGFVLLRVLLLLTLDNSEPRYTLECFPIVILLASFALAKPTPPAIDSP
jgi:4-amino-4-deoxy-L-arabinose transferase-like glycosyltransferase